MGDVSKWDSAAIANLKAKLQNMVSAKSDAIESAAEGMVGLSAKYVHVNINPDWDENDHPRDPKTGEFMKAPGGFIFGKTKNAKFPLDGGTMIFDLKPGDVVFKTLAGNLIVSHSDGSYSLHQKGTKHGQAIPAGSNSLLADKAANGEFKKVAENPGTLVKAATQKEAEHKIEAPADFKAPEASAGSAWDIPAPALKPGKDKYTAKQYAEYQASVEGLIMFTDSKGQPVKAGGWVDVDGKPYKLYPSPYEGFGLTTYRWVSTKQQASNLEKENFFKMSDSSGMTVIPDPTGKPYGVAQTEKSADVSAPATHGSLMSQAVTGAIPNTATAHKNALKDSIGTYLLVKGGMLMDSDEKPIKGGEWVEIEGKPFQVFFSPNEGNVSLAKWVSTKKKASNNTYDFPIDTIHKKFKKIPDPTGADYTPLADKPEPETAQKYIDKHEAGIISTDQLQLLIDHGASDVSSAASEALETITGTTKPSASIQFMLDLQSDWSLEPQSDDADVLPFLPTGTILGLTYKPSDNLPSFLMKTEEGDWEFMPESMKSLGEKATDSDMVQKIGQATSVMVTPVTSSNYSHTKDGDFHYAVSQVLHTSPAVAYHKRGATWYYANSIEPADSADLMDIQAMLTQEEEISTNITNMPVGGTFKTTYLPTGSVTTYTKLENGDWSSTSTAAKISEKGLLSVITQPNAKNFSYDFTKKSKIPDTASAMPINSVLTHISGSTYKKIGTDAWTSPQTGYKFVDADFATGLDMESFTYEAGDGVEPTPEVDLTDAASMPIGTVLKHEAGSSYTKKFNNPGSQNWENNKTGHKFYDTSFKNGLGNGAVTIVSMPDAAPKSEPAPVIPSTPAGLKAESSNKFVHPVSGETFDMQPGDIVHKHKSTENGYIIERPGAEYPIFFFNAHGKLYKPKASQKNTGYEPIAEWPGKQEQVPDSPTGVVKATGALVMAALPGDKLVLTTPDGSEFSYVMKHNGKWTVQNGGEANSTMLASFADDAYYTKAEFHPSSSALDVPSDVEAKAPWGGDAASEVAAPLADWEQELLQVGKYAPDYVAPAEKKPAKGKKVAPPKSFSTPAGDHELKPGQWAGKVKSSNGNMLFVLYVNPKNKYEDKFQFWNENGASVGDYYLNQNTVTEMKKSVKENGGLIAEFPLEKNVGDFSNYKPNKSLDFDSAWELNSYYNTTFGGNWNGKGIPTTWDGSIHSYGDFSKFGHPDVTYNSLSLDQKIAIFASYKDLAGQAYVDLDQTELTGQADEKSTKASVTKIKNGVSLVHRIAETFEAYLDPDTKWTDEDFAQAHAFIYPKAIKPGMAMGGDTVLKSNFPLLNAIGLMEQAETHRQWKKSVAGLGFDLDTGTSADFVAYAKTQGMDYLGALDEVDQKKWVLAQVGDPSLDNYEKNQINKKAAKAKDMALVATLAASLKPSKPEELPAPKVVGVTAKTSLMSSYKIGESDLSNIGPDEWTLYQNDTGVEIVVTDALVSAMVNNALEQGTEISSSSKPAYGDVSLSDSMKKLETKYGFEFSPTEEDYNYHKKKMQQAAASMGCTVSSHFSMLGIKRWLVMAAAGDAIGVYALETNTVGEDHEEKFTHPGSPFSPAGQIAHMALAQEVNAQPWGQEFFNGYYPKQMHDFADKKMGGLNEFNNSVSSPVGVSWQSYHNGAELKKYLSGVAVGGVATQPSSVSDDSWAIINNATPGMDFETTLGASPAWSMSDTQLDQHITAHAAESKFYLGSVPTHLKRLAVWSLMDDRDGQFSQAVVAKAKAGEFFEETTPVWIAPGGNKYPISPGSMVYKYGSNYAIMDAEMTSGQWVQGNGQMGSTLPSYMLAEAKQGGESWEKIFQMPGFANWIQAQKDEPSLSEDMWDIVSNIESGQNVPYALQAHAVGPVLTAALKNNTTLEKEYPHLYAQHQSLPENVRQSVWAALDNGYPGILAVMEYKASTGHYASMQTKGMYDHNQPWLPNLSKGQTSADDVMQHWSSEAKKKFVQFFDLPDADSIAPYLDKVLNPQTAIISKTLPTFDNLSLTWAKSKSKGMHSGEIWVDQEGNEWMSKAFPNDPNQKARVDAETVANQIGTLYGFLAPTVATTNVKKLSNNDPNSKNYAYAYLQHMKPAVKDFAAVSPKDLTPTQLGQAMSEHVADWITSNHDSHSGNLMLGTDGKVFGIDKGQAFKFFPDDQLAVGYLPPGNGAPVWYDLFYAGVKNGSITKNVADEVTKHVLRTAQKVSKDKDEEYRELLQTAFQNREFWPSKYPNRESFIDALVERKHNTFEAFIDLYKGLYASSPYDFDIDTENLNPPTLDEHTHIIPSTDYANDVATSTAHGKAIFFDTDHLDDTHLLMSTAKDKDGSLMLTGEAKVTPKGDKVLTEWLAAQTVDKQYNSGYAYNPPSFSEQSIPQPPNWKDPSHQPMTAEWFSTMVAGSKTVSSHNKSGDTNYNAGTLQNVENTHTAMVKAKKWLDDGATGNPGIQGMPSDFEFQTDEQKVAWGAMLDTYLDYYKQIIDAKGTSNKISPHFSQPHYQPSKEALAELKAKQEQVSAEKPDTADVAPVGTKMLDSTGITWTKIAKHEPNKPAWESTTGGKCSGGLMDQSWSNMKFGSLPKIGEKPATADVAPVGTVMHHKTNGVDYEKNANGWNEVGQSHVFNASFVDAAWAGMELKSLPEGSEPEDEGTVTNTIQVGTKVLKVTYRPSAIKDGKFNFDTGELELKGGEQNASGGGFVQSGAMYEIDFGTTKVFYRPWEGSNVNKAQRGLLRFERANWDSDDYQSIEEIFDVLRQTGLDLDPASEESMELYYWSHMSEILADRADGNTAKWGKVNSYLKTNLKDGMTKAEQLNVQKDAWASAIGQDMVDKADWMPKFSRQSIHAQKDNDNFTSGHPYWFRPDVTLESMKAAGVTLASTNLTYGGNEEDALPIAQSGSMLSSEERARYYGSVAKSGGSSSSDQGKGSSGTVFTRPGSVGSNEVVYHPRVYLRTSNYRFAGDEFGNIDAKKTSAHWDPSKAFSEGYEMCVKHSISVMDDILILKFPNENLRQKAIKAYKDQGITMLHGVPIEEVFRTSSSSTHTNKIWEAAIKAEKENANG